MISWIITFIIIIIAFAVNLFNVRDKFSIGGKRYNDNRSSNQTDNKIIEDSESTSYFSEFNINKLTNKLNGNKMIIKHANYGHNDAQKHIPIARVPIVNPRDKRKNVDPIIKPSGTYEKKRTAKTKLKFSPVINVLEFDKDLNGNGFKEQYLTDIQ